MTQEDQFIASKFDVIGYMFLSPIFFASIGLKVDGDAVCLWDGQLQYLQYC